MTNNLLPLILQVEDFHSSPMNPNVLIVAVCSEESFNNGHIPGSHLIKPAELIRGEKPAVGKIPEVEQLSALFSRIGLTENKHVVVYDDEGGGWAGRLIWTLDVIGHQHYSYLDGGIIAWRDAKLPLEVESQVGPRSVYQATINKSLLVDLDQVQEQIDNPDSVIWDARASEEHDGVKVTALRNGHIPGAKNLDWLELMDKTNSLKLKPLEDIRSRLADLGIDSSKSIITHCQTHHRSGLTYLVGKALGFTIKAYDGSWSEWGNHPATPIET